MINMTTDTQALPADTQFRIRNTSLTGYVVPDHQALTFDPGYVTGRTVDGGFRIHHIDNLEVLR